MKIAFLGIDISKKTFDVALLIEDKYRTKKFNNSQPGFKRLLEWISNKDISLQLACMEATGVYSEDLAIFLFNNDIKISVVNPARVKGFAQSQLSRSKTDESDAKLIAEFAKRMQPESWTPPPEHIKLLQAYTRRLEDLIQMHRQEENRLEVVCDELKNDVSQNVEMFKMQIKDLRKKICIHIKNHPDLKEKDALLRSIPAVGDTVSSKILGVLCEIEKFSTAKQVAAFIGLNPKQRQSGTSVKGRTTLSKTGNKEIRKALYMPALTAIKYNPILKNFYERLINRGKSKMCAIGAVMRKMVHIIFGVLKSGQEFDENYLKTA